MGVSTLQNLTNARLDLFDFEWLPLDFRVALGWHEVLRANDFDELSEIELWDEHSLEALKQLAQIPRQRVHIMNVRMRNVQAAISAALNGFADGAVRRAPAEHE